MRATLVDVKFDHVQCSADVVIVGITPGKTQERLAMSEENKGLTSRAIKLKCAFHGRNMEQRLVEVLDRIGLNSFLGIETCKTIWSADNEKVEMTSLLKKAAYVDGNALNRLTDIDKYPEFKKEFETGFKSDCSKYSQARIFVAVGKTVFEKLSSLVDDGTIKVPVVRIPHPSGQNMKRISEFVSRGGFWLQLCIPQDWHGDLSGIIPRR